MTKLIFASLILIGATILPTESYSQASKAKSFSSLQPDEKSAFCRSALNKAKKMQRGRGSRTANFNLTETCIRNGGKV